MAQEDLDRMQRSLDRLRKMDALEAPDAIVTNEIAILQGALNEYAASKGVETLQTAARDMRRWFGKPEHQTTEGQRKSLVRLYAKAGVQ